MITAICLLAYRNVRMSGIVCKTSLPDAEKYSGYRTGTADVMMCVACLSSTIYLLQRVT